MKKLNLVRTIILAGSLLLQLSTLCFHSRGAAGDVDLSFDPGSGVNGPVSVVAVQPDGKVIIGGAFTTVNGLTRPGLARLNADGSGDSSFNPGTGPNYDVVSSVAVQSDGKVLIGGSFTAVNGTNRFNIARLHADGSLDNAFNTQLETLVPYDEIPPSYGGAHSAATTAIRVQADGKILVAGYGLALLTGEETWWVSIRYFLYRFHADGSLDTSFSGAIGNPVEWGGWYYSWYTYPPTAMAVQPDGKVVVSGAFDSINGTNRNGIARLNADGSVDGSFNPGIGGSVSSVALQADGKVLIGGFFIYNYVSSTNYSRGIARLNTNGSQDSTFNPGAGVAGDSHPVIKSVAAQSDGKVLIGGFFLTVNGTNRNNIARLNGNGSLDGGFNPGTGPNGNVLSIALQSDGNVLIGGDFTIVNGAARPRVARLYGDSVPPSLSITRSNALVIISWPVTGLNFQFQETTDLSLPNSWSPVAQPAVTNAGQISVTIPTTVGGKFFRLKSQ